MEDAVGAAEVPIVHVVDDDDGVRDSVALLLGAAGMASRTYASARSLLEIAPAFALGCVLTDVMMPEIDGLRLQERLKADGVRLPVVIMTAHADVPIAVRALKAGAFDFVEKPFAEERLLTVVRAALAHNAAQHRRDREIQQIEARLASLTPREREVLDGLVAGQSNKAIALDLGTSPRTVEVQRARIMEKMGAHSLSELVRMALQVTRRAA